MSLVKWTYYTLADSYAFTLDSFFSFNLKNFFSMKWNRNLKILVEVDGDNMASFCLWIKGPKAL